MCECASISAGMTVLPLRSTRAAPGGAATSPFRPTRLNLLFSTRNAAFSIGVTPSPKNSRAPSNNVARLAAGGPWAATIEITAANVTEQAISSLRLFIKPLSVAFEDRAYFFNTEGVFPFEGPWRAILLFPGHFHLIGRKKMPTLIKEPSIIQAAGTKPKRIEEYAGRVNS